MILVTGATGTTGNAVARKLLKMGQEIRVFVRDPEKAREMGLGSAEIIEGDFNNADSVKAALDGVDKAYMVFYAYPDLTPLENGFVDRGKESGVEHIVRLSVLQSVIDHNLQLGKIHREREKCLEDSGIAWTHLHPHFFMQNYIRMKDVIKNKKAIFSPITDARVCPVDVEDIGEVAAIALTQSGHESKTYELTGPAALTLNEIAQKFSEITGNEIKFIPTDLESAKQGFISTGMDEWLADALIELFSHWQNGFGDTVESAIQEITGHPARSLDTFIEENKNLFA